MPKKVFAVTNVKVGSGPGQFIPAGEELNVTELGLTKAQLLELHAGGAIEVRTVDDEVAEASEVDPSDSETSEENDSETPKENPPKE